MKHRIHQLSLSNLLPLDRVLRASSEHNRPVVPRLDRHILPSALIVQDQIAALMRVGKKPNHSVVHMWEFSALELLFIGTRTVNIRSSISWFFVFFGCVVHDKWKWPREEKVSVAFERLYN